ncbi:hypothetical protein [Prevotella sp. 10(H)]|uniref:hypothetical protein n=1 Tax=Prevotella sp. 10(H) TaxID=1158294 RepID=UPI0004A7337C|nr:hypothetical protein [Prevotella sp. 10(H)]
MAKINISFEKIRKYLLDVSVVVIGVAITLAASYWITGNNERRDMALYLDTIKLELEENKSMLDSTVKRLQPSVKYADYLRSHDMKSLNADTIRFYAPFYLEVASINIKTDAFDMFKTSGNMRLVKDKKLLLTIWETYARLAEFKETFDSFMQMKTDEIRKEVELRSLYDLWLLPDEELLKNVPIHKYYTRISAPYMLPAACKHSSNMISETITKLEEAK